MVLSPGKNQLHVLLDIIETNEIYHRVTGSFHHCQLTVTSLCLSCFSETKLRGRSRQHFKFRVSCRENFIWLREMLENRILPLGNRKVISIKDL